MTENTTFLLGQAFIIAECHFFVTENALLFSFSFLL